MKWWKFCKGAAKEAAQQEENSRMIRMGSANSKGAFAPAVQMTDDQTTDDQAASDDKPAED